MRGKIKITLEHLRIAAKKPRSGTPMCHDETMKVLNALEASKFQAAPLHKYVKEANDCLERSKMERKHRKPSTLYHLTKYLVRNKNRRK